MRNWTTGEVDGAIHAMGNGQMVAYGNGPDLSSLYGPPYSSPSLLSITTKCAEQVRDTAEREIKTAIWKHNTVIAGQNALEFIEFIASDVPAYIRLVECEREGVNWVIHPHHAGGFKPSVDIAGAWQQIIRPGEYIYNYPTNLWSYQWIITQGSCRAELAESGEIIVRCVPGEGSLAIVSASDYPSGVLNAEHVVARGIKSFLEPTRNNWNSFTERRLAAKPELTKLPADVRELLDGVAVLIKSQQSDAGGVMAGHCFALAYIRDQHGTAKGMLTLGMLDEAKLNLRFRLRKFDIFGTLQTAESMGTDCARHIHENDEVEGPGYTILQARDYIQATGDDTFGREMWPMLEWCWKVQSKHLAGGLLPFNGDETYVAGGFFPRSGLNQGSADSTLVFIESGKWLAQWAVAQGFWTEQIAKSQIELIEQASMAYRRSFFTGDRIWASAPEREKVTDLPRFRHGVCEGMCSWFGWTERSNRGRYLCPNCLGHKDIPKETPAPMEVNSVSLLPAYLESDILTDEEKLRVINHVLSLADESGHISSVPGTPGCVGYDSGLILISLTQLHHAEAQRACERMLSMVDNAGSWNEYYAASDAQRACCHARPWESGINAYALVQYLAGQCLIEPHDLSKSKSGERSSV